MMKEKLEITFKGVVGNVFGEFSFSGASSLSIDCSGKSG